MIYSIIFCYRNREDHLKIIIPRMREVFANKNSEIIVVEQADDLKFRRGNLLNEGAKVAVGDVLILHDIDYYPENVTYYDEITSPDVYLPVHKVEFVNNDLTPKPINMVPSGYQAFRNGVDDNFFGGVIAFRRDAFFKINGFNSSYVGWGFEDADLRERIRHHNLTTQRNKQNLFYALDHTDNCPPQSDYDFQNNMKLSANPSATFAAGVNTQHSLRYYTIPKFAGISKWIMATDFTTTEI